MSKGDGAMKHGHGDVLEARILSLAKPTSLHRTYKEAAAVI